MIFIMIHKCSFRVIPLHFFPYADSTKKVIKEISIQVSIRFIFALTCCAASNMCKVPVGAHLQLATSRQLDVTQRIQQATMASAPPWRCDRRYGGDTPLFSEQDMASIFQEKVLTSDQLQTSCGKTRSKHQQVDT